MTVKLKVNGPIIDNDDKWIYELFEMDATCPKDIVDSLPSNGEDVEITINSYGGLVDAGNEIYTALKLYNGPITIDVIMAGSAASIVAMAGNPTRISPVGQIMIHNVSMINRGDYHDMDKASEILKKSNESLANAYMIKTGLSQEDLLAKMDVETWLTADEAVELGFADEKLFQAEERPLLVANVGSGLLSKTAINKVKEMKNNKVANITVNSDEIAEKVFEKIKIENEEEPQKGNKSPFERFLF